MEPQIERRELFKMGEKEVVPQGDFETLDKWIYNRYLKDASIEDKKQFLQKKYPNFEFEDLNGEILYSKDGETFESVDVPMSETTTPDKFASGLELAADIGIPTAASIAGGAAGPVGAYGAGVAGTAGVEGLKELLARSLGGLEGNESASIKAAAVPIGAAAILPPVVSKVVAPVLQKTGEAIYKKAPLVSRAMTNAMTKGIDTGGFDVGKVMLDENIYGTSKAIREQLEKKLSEWQNQVQKILFEVDQVYQQTGKRVSVKDTDAYKKYVSEINELRPSELSPGVVGDLKYQNVMGSIYNPDEVIKRLEKIPSKTTSKVVTTESKVLKPDGTPFTKKEIIEEVTPETPGFTMENLLLEKRETGKLLPDSAWNQNSTAAEAMNTENLKRYYTLAKDLIEENVGNVKGKEVQDLVRELNKKSGAFIDTDRVALREILKDAQSAPKTIGPTSTAAAAAGGPKLLAAKYLGNLAATDAFVSTLGALTNKAGKAATMQAATKLSPALRNSSVLMELMKENPDLYNRIVQESGE